MPVNGFMTVAEIDVELAALRKSRLSIITKAEKAVSYTVQGRQVTVTGPTAIERLNAHENYLLSQRVKAERDAAGHSRGVRIRYGNVR